MHADEIVRRRAKSRASEVIGSVDVLVAKMTSGPSTACAFLRRLGLDRAILEHGFDDEIAASSSS